MTDDYQASSDFNCDKDYVADPLIPRGVYAGKITEIKYSPIDCYILWEVTFQGNEGMLMTDEKTTVDGVRLAFFNYLPKPGDEDIMTPKGKSTKRQAKINMLADFGKIMGLSAEMNNLESIQTYVDGKDAIGFDVSAAVTINDWNGTISNRIDRLTPQR
jgi:hypothetical protein